MNKSLSILSVIVALALSGGCKTPTLQSGGAYAPATITITANADGSSTTNYVATSAPDLVLFDADLTYSTAYATLDAVFKIEETNRAMLWSISPSIKHDIDAVRKQALIVNQQWALARQAYIANPIPVNLTALQQTLARVQQLVTAVNAAIAKGSK